MPFPKFFALSLSALAIFLIASVSALTAAIFLLVVASATLLRRRTRAKETRKNLPAGSSLEYLKEEQFWQEESRQNIANQATSASEQRRAI